MDMREHIKNYKLANGLEVFLIEKEAIPMATVLIAVKNGAFAETEENNGLAHLYEHMFFKANEKIPNQPLFLQALDEMGIELGPNMNATTATEAVRYYFTVQTQYLERGLKFMSDAVITPKFVQEELEKERKVVIGEFDRYEASPTDVFFQRNVLGKMFKKYFVRKNTIGSRPVILNATQAQMKEIQHRYYNPNNTALFVVGEFNEADVRKTIEKNYGDWKPGPNPFEQYPVPEHPPLEKTEQFIEHAPVQTVHFAQGYHGPKMTINDQEIRALDLVSAMLQFQSSAFQKELVHSQLATHASMFVWSQRYTSPLFFTIESMPGESQKAYSKLQELIARIAKGGFFSEQDLQIAKTSVEVHSSYDRESGQRYALELANVWTSTGNLDFYLKYVDEMKKITVADIDQVVKKYFSQPYVLGVLMPKGAKPIKFLDHKS